MALYPIVKRFIFLGSTLTLMLSGCGASEPTSGTSTVRKETPDWFRITDSGDSILKAKINLGPNPTPGTEFCPLPKGTHYYLASQGMIVTGNYAKVQLAEPIADCPLSNGPALVFLPHLTERTEFDFQPLGNEQLTNRLNSLLAKSRDSDTRWSVEIRAFGPYDQRYNLFSSRAREAVRPASTLKIFTTWTALRLWPSASDTGSSTFSYLKEMMKFSDNNMAQSTYDRLGGTPAVMETFAQAKIQPNEGFRMLDGSGLRYDNRVAAHDLINVLMSIRASSKMQAFRAMLPIAGVDGTLASRMTNIPGKVSAKTGTLTSDPAAALAGYGDGRNGWQIVFAMLGDSVPSVDAGRNAIDQMVTAALQTINTLPTTSPSFEYLDAQSETVDGLAQAR